jgi:hypothetical protein
MVGSFLECCTAGTALEWNRDLPYDGENLDAGNERSRGVPFAIHQFCPLRSRAWICSQAYLNARSKAVSDRRRTPKDLMT